MDNETSRASPDADMATPRAPLLAWLLLPCPASVMAASVPFTVYCFGFAGVALQPIAAIGCVTGAFFIAARLSPKSKLLMAVLFVLQLFTIPLAYVLAVEELIPDK